MLQWDDGRGGRPKLLPGWQAWGVQLQSLQTSHTFNTWKRFQRCERASLSRQEILNVNDNECITVICIFLNLCTTAMAAVACRHAQFRTRRRAAAAGTNMPHKDRSRSMFKAALFGGGGGKKKTTNKRQGNGDSGCVVITRPKRCRRSSLLTFSEACTAFISCRSLCVFDRLFKIPRVSLRIFSLLLLYYIPCCCLFISKP